MGSDFSSTTTLKFSAMGTVAHSFQSNYIKAALIGILNLSLNWNVCASPLGGNWEVLSGLENRSGTSPCWKDFTFEPAFGLLDSNDT